MIVIHGKYSTPKISQPSWLAPRSLLGDLLPEPFFFPLDLLPLILLVTAAILMAAAAPVVDGDHVLQQVYLFLVLPRDGEGVVFCRERLFFPFLFKEALLYLIFLLLPDLYHHFFDSGVHLFAVFLAGETVSVDPGVLEQVG